MIYTEIIDTLAPEKTISQTVTELLALDIGGFSLGNILAAALIFLVCLAVIKLAVRLTRRALERTMNISAYESGRLAGCLRTVVPDLEDAPGAIGLFAE